MLCLLFFFFLMIRPPPRSPLFPYPTLSRSHHAAEHVPRQRSVREQDVEPRLGERRRVGVRRIALQIGRDARRSARSEEHTSELQSQSNLVCRLLLEKKKNNKHDLCPHAHRT